MLRGVRPAYGFTTEAVVQFGMIAAAIALALQVFEFRLWAMTCLMQSAIADGNLAQCITAPQVCYCRYDIIFCQR